MYGKRGTLYNSDEIEFTFIFIESKHQNEINDDTLQFFASPLSGSNTFQLAYLTNTWIEFNQ
jgi:hypothetical protein